MVKKLTSIKKTGKQIVELDTGREDRRARKKTTTTFSNKLITEILNQAREYARLGKHGKTIELCTETLDAIGTGNSCHVQAQMDLLGIRLESYLAWLKREAAEKDVALMVDLADKVAKPALKAQALICKGRVQINLGQFGLAYKTLSTALEFARQSGQKMLEAESLFILWGAQTGEKQIETTKQAAEIYLSLGDKYHAGLALTRLAGSYRVTGRIDKARQFAHQALEICKEVGNTLGVGNAYNTLSNMDTDLVLRIRHQKLASQAFEAAGHLGQLAGTANNLGYIYYDLGLYSRAQHYYQKALDIYPAHFYPLANSIYLELELKELEQAVKHIEELRSMFIEGRSFNYDPTIMEDLSGRLALLDNKPEIAAKHFKNVIRISHESGHAKEIGSLTWLGKVRLAEGSFLSALKTTYEAVKRHQELGFPSVDDHPSQGIWWQHAQALLANQKMEEAEQALEKAYDFLLQGITNMRDEGLRRNYLNKVALNREILEAWLKYGSDRRLPKARRYAHLTIESGLREPFERLAEISLELNALHTLEEIQTFLVEEAIEIVGGERVLLILERDGEFALTESYVPVGEDAQKSFTAVRKYLEKARVSRIVQLIASKRSRRSRIVAPLVAQRNLLGYLYTDMDSIYGSFDETDRGMLGMLANQGAVALENARLVEGLEGKVRERTAELQAANVDLEQRNAELALINAVQQALASRLETQEIYEAVGEQFRINSDFQEVGIYSLVLNSHTVSKVYSCKIGKRFPPGMEPNNSLYAYLFQLQDSLVVNGDFPQFVAKFNDYQAPREGIPRSILSVPVRSGNDEDEVVLLILQDMDGTRLFTSADVRLVETIAGLMGASLERKYLRDQEKAYLRALERELEIGHDIQMSFLPSVLPVVRGWEVEASLKAAREVAGDFYDVFTLDSDNIVCLIIGDVCDKGVGAALFMTLFRSLVRFTMGAANGFGERSPASKLKYAVTLTNNYIADTHGETGMFATIFFGLLDANKGVLTYINAGHEPPVILGLDGTWKLLGRTGMSVGVLPDWEFQVEQVLMKPGDLFFAFTDGAPEMNDPSGNFFGKERLLHLLGNGGKSASEVIVEINGELIEHIGNGKQFDDITLLAVRRAVV